MFDLQQIKSAGFEEVLRQMPAAVIVVEAPSGKIIFRNRRAQRWREESLSQARAAKLEDAGDFEIFHPDGRPYEIEEWPLMRSIRDGEEVRGEELVYPIADGTRLLLRCDSSPIYDDQGRIVAGVLVAHDITDRKRAEEELQQEASRRIENILESIDEFSTVDREWRFTYINERALASMRAVNGEEELTREDVLGKSIWDVFPEVVGSVFYQKYHEAMREQKTVEVETHSPFSDRWGEVHAYPSEEGLSLYSRDITERKQAEEKLRRSEERFRLLVEGVRDYAIFMLDPTGRIESWNEGARRIKGYSQEEILGQHFSIFYPPEDVERGKPEHELREAETQGVYEEEGWRVRKDGSKFWASVLITALRDEARQLRGFSKVTRDITERKRAEERLAYHARLLENVHDAVIATDERLVVTAWNKGAEQMYDWRADEVLGRNLWEAVPVDLSEEQRAEALRELSERGRLRIEALTYAKDGTPVYVEGITIALRGEQGEGEITGYVNIRRDISGRKWAEERVEEGREAERSRLARDLHDEALQWLTDALVQTQQIQRTSEDPQQTLRLARLLATLDRIGPHLRGAIYDLRLEGEQEKVFAELLKCLVELHRGMAPESDIALEVHDGVLSEPLGERGRELLRILGEALTNVRRHSGASHVRVDVGITEEKLWAEVEDDGRGFDAAEGSEEAVSATGGLGIRGMRERARALGGELKIESEPGKRTKVRFEMALKKEREQPEEEEKVRILLVEDHAIFREALASNLKREEASFEVVGQAGSLAEARRILQEEQQQADVAVIDLGLPDGYGGDLIKELREANPQAQALVLSAAMDRAKIARAVEAGAAGVLNKTAHLEEVVEALRRLRRGETLLPLEEVVELLRFSGRRRDEEHDAHQAREKLTPREREVLQTLAEGLDSQEIAERLHISLRTERNHITSILAKLGVHSQLQALVFALRYGVAEIP